MSYSPTFRQRVYCLLGSWGLPGQTYQGLSKRSITHSNRLEHTRPPSSYDHSWRPRTHRNQDRETRHTTEERSPLSRRTNVDDKRLVLKLSTKLKSRLLVSDMLAEAGSQACTRSSMDDRKPYETSCQKGSIKVRFAQSSSTASTSTSFTPDVSVLSSSGKGIPKRRRVREI